MLVRIRCDLGLMSAGFGLDPVAVAQSLAAIGRELPQVPSYSRIVGWGGRCFRLAHEILRRAGAETEQGGYQNCGQSFSVEHFVFLLRKRSD